MKKIFLLTIAVLTTLFSLSCILDGGNGDDDDDGNDTIIGWEKAGIISIGADGQHVDVCKYSNHLFTFNYRGELFHGTYPELVWTQMVIPDGYLAYEFYCDTLQGLLYLATRKNCAVYEYNISSDQWRSLVPKNSSWFDSTKLLDGELYTNMYSMTIHNNKLFIMTAQGWTDSTGNKRYRPTIWCSGRDTIWEKADSGWYNNQGYSDQATDFFSIDDYLYASTFEAGLWRYNGIQWSVVPGTSQKEVQDIVLSGGDSKVIPGFRPRSIVKHGNDIYVGNLRGDIYKLLPGDTWDRTGFFYKDFTTNDTIENAGPAMFLYSYNGIMVKGIYYYKETADLWYNMTPYFDKFDTTYSNSLPGTVYGMTNIGDTLFAALGNDEGKHSGVYFLDLKKCKWYTQR